MTAPDYVRPHIPVTVRPDGSYTAYAVDAEPGEDVREDGQDDSRVTHWITAHIERPRPQIVSGHAEEVKR